jgi:hypothetical protein
MRKIILIIGIISLFSLFSCSPQIEDNNIKNLYKIEAENVKIDNDFAKNTKYHIKCDDPFKQDKEIVIILDEKKGYIKYMNIRWEEYINTKYENIFCESEKKSSFLKKYAKK